MQIHVPLPTELIYCTSCRANVVPDARGRCPADDILGLYPDGRPRPPMVTETLVTLQEASRVNTWSGRGVHPAPRGLRVLPGGRR